MKHSIKQIITKEFKSLFVIKKTERLWHIPFLATLCTGIPLFVSLYSNNLQSGLLACLAGLVILYLPAKSSLANRLATAPPVASPAPITKHTFGVDIVLDI